MCLVPVKASVARYIQLRNELYCITYYGFIRHVIAVVTLILYLIAPSLATTLYLHFYYKCRRSMNRRGWMSHMWPIRTIDPCWNCYSP